MNQRFSGRHPLLTLLDHGPHVLLVAVPCLIGSPERRTNALFDTGSEWCALEWGLAEALGFNAEEMQSSVLYHTRFGLIRGSLERLPLRLLATDGDELEIEATFFTSPDWPGPTVLGWRGGLERIAFAVDPSEEWFYFAAPNQAQGQNSTTMEV